MDGLRVTVTTTREQTRVLVQGSEGDCLLAQLPAFTSYTHHRALPTLLEALALWSNQPLRVVLFVDDRFEWRKTGLADTLDAAAEAFLYHIEVVPLPHEALPPAKPLSLSDFTFERSLGRVTA